MAKDSVSSHTEKEGSTLSLPFLFLLVFVFLNFTHIQEFSPLLEALRLPEISIIAALVSLVLSSQKNISFSSNTKIIFMLFILSIISLIDSIWLGRSVEILTDIYVRALVVYFIIVTSIVRFQQLKTFLKVVVVCSLYISLYAINNYISGNYFEGVAAEGRIGGPPGIAGGSNDMALTLVMILPLTITFYHLTKNNLSKIYYLGVAFFSLCGIVVSSSRGGLVALVGLILFALTTKARKKIIPILILMVLGLPIYIQFLPDHYINRMTTIVDHQSDATGSAELRKRDMLRALEIIKTYPVNGVGFGLNGLALKYGASTGFGGVHNAFLQVGADCGIAAMLLYILFFYRTYKQLKENGKETTGESENDVEQQMRLLSVGASISVVGFAVGAFFLPVAYRWCFYYLAGIVVVLLKMNEQIKDH